MYVKPVENQSKGLTPGRLGLLEFHNLFQFVYEKLEKRSLWSFVGRPRKLLIRNSSSNSQILGLLCHVIVVNVEHHLLRSVVTQQGSVEL